MSEDFWGDCSDGEPAGAIGQHCHATGGIELASYPEVAAGQVTTKAVSPGALREYIRAAQQVDLNSYLQRAGTLPDAIALALTENGTAGTAVTFLGPPAEIAWPAGRTVTKANGLRSHLRFDFSRTLIYRDFAGATPGGQAWLAWDEFSPNDRISFLGGRFEGRNIGGAGNGANVLSIRGGTNIFSTDLELKATYHASLASDGTRWCLGFSGSQDSTFLHTKLDGAQLAICGLGFSAKNVLVDGVQAKNCNDFAVSACGGGGIGLDGTNGQLKGIRLLNLQLDGLMGAGGVLLGTDGEVTPMAEVSDITVDGLRIRGPRSLLFAPTSGVGLRMFAGTITKGIYLLGGRVCLDTGTGIQAIHLRGLAATDIEDVRMTDWDIDLRNTSSSVDAVRIEAPAGGRGVRLRGIIARGGRLAVTDLDDVRLEECESYNGRIDIGPTSRNVDQYLIRSCRVLASTNFPFVCSAVGTRNITNLRVENSWLEAQPGGHANVFASMNGGTFSWRARTNIYKGGTGPNAEALAGLVAAGSHNNEIVP